jgi:hypothetical protein
MVNPLLTFFIRVNVPQLPNRSFAMGGNPMKKHSQGRFSFWTWLLGGGGGGGGDAG